ncbi:MAG: hypothetical protein AAFV96_16235, partial [Pseudomonadota bacterium]
FATTVLPLALLALVLFARRAPVPRAARIHLAAPGLVLAAGLLISFHSPVLSPRNLAVLVPGLSLAAALAVPDSLLTPLRQRPWAAIVLLAAAILYADRATREFQMIPWAARAATAPACDGAPLYAMAPDVVDRFAQEVFGGGTTRPLVEITTFEPPADLPEGCDVLAVGWHEVGGLADLEAFFASRDQPVLVVSPPDGRLAAARRVSSGFIVRVQP